MSKKSRQIAKRLLPPVLVDVFRRIGAPTAPVSDRYEALGSKWPLASDSNPGWEDSGIARTQASRWREWCDFCAGTGPLDIPHEAASPSSGDMQFHNIYMTFGYVLALASAGKKEMSILDWGGGLGHYSVLAEALLPDTTIEYHCKDLPAFCEQGAALLPEATFYTGDSCLQRTYDFVIASGSLQCSGNWEEILTGLAKAASGYLYVTRLPVLFESPSTVVRQRTREQGFSGELLGWFLNRQELLAASEAAGMRLVREFFLVQHPAVDGIAEQAQVRGFLLRA